MRNAKAIWGAVFAIIAGLLSDLTPASAQKITATAGVSRNPLGSSARSIRQEWGKPWSADSRLVHTGVDIAAKKGSVVRATAGGIVFQSNWLGCKDRTTNCAPADPGKSWGYYVVVRQDNGRAQAYLHVTKTIPAGTPIKTGEKVGDVFENHLHYNECRAADLCYRGAATPAEFNQGRWLKPNI